MIPLELTGNETDAIRYIVTGCVVLGIVGIFFLGCILETYWDRRKK